MITPEIAKRSQEVVDQIYDLVVARLTSVDEGMIYDEMLALAIGFQTWALTIESKLLKRDQSYTRQVSTEAIEDGSDSAENANGSDSSSAAG